MTSFASSLSGSEKGDVSYVERMVHWMMSQRLLPLLARSILLPKCAWLFCCSLAKQRSHWNASTTPARYFVGERPVSIVHDDVLHDDLAIRAKDMGWRLGWRLVLQR